MEFDTKRMMKLAGVPDTEPVASGRSASRPLVESARRTPAMSADEQKLRSLIRREAQRMLSERATRSASPDVTDIQRKRSLTEAITMGFAGFGFGGKSPVLGGPMTSASRFASLYESEVDEIDEGEKDELDEIGGSPDPESPNYDRDDERGMEKGG